MIRLPRCIAAGLLLAVATLPLGACDRAGTVAAPSRSAMSEIRATDATSRPLSTLPRHTPSSIPPPASHAAFTSISSSALRRKPATRSSGSRRLGPT